VISDTPTLSPPPASSEDDEQAVSINDVAP